jgi:hypothetical protein
MSNSFGYFYSELRAWVIILQATFPSMSEREALALAIRCLYVKGDSDDNA